LIVFILLDLRVDSMPMLNVSALNRRFGIAGALRFAKGEGGLTQAEIKNAQGEATVVLQGAHLIRWTPAGQQPVIWLSPAARFAKGKAIRGGIPVCWPWFGAHPSDASLQSHGFARATPWQVAETGTLADGSVRLVLQWVRDDATLAQWPHSTPVQISFVFGEALEIELTTRNFGPAPATISEALHAYFAVGDARQIQVEGLEGCEYLDKTKQGQRKLQNGPLVFEAELDRVYLNTSSDCLILDPGLARRIRIAKRGSASTIVWNPWKDKAANLGDMGAEDYIGMVCVETANAAENAVSIAPGEAHALWARYSVESLE
jgi:glucose-6-phosphate 1-epimerase